MTLNWPSATNGNLQQIKLDGDMIYEGPAIAGGTANLTTAQLDEDQNHRKIKKGQADVLDFVFQKNADTNTAHYAEHGDLRAELPADGSALARPRTRKSERARHQPGPLLFCATLRSATARDLERPRWSLGKSPSTTYLNVVYPE